MTEIDVINWVIQSSGENGHEEDIEDSENGRWILVFCCNLSENL